MIYYFSTVEDERSSCGDGFTFLGEFIDNEVEIGVGRTEDTDSSKLIHNMKSG